MRRARVPQSCKRVAVSRHPVTLAESDGKPGGANGRHDGRDHRKRHQQARTFVQEPRDDHGARKDAELPAPTVRRPVDPRDRRLRGCASEHRRDGANALDVQHGANHAPGHTGLRTAS